MVFQGSLPGLRTMVSPVPRVYASGAAKTKPRDSMPMIFSTRSPRQRSASASMTCLKRRGWERMGVMSLKTTPGLGKSGTSRMAARTAASMALSFSTGSGEEEQRVSRAGALPDLEVEVGPAAAAGLAHPGDGLAGPDRGPLLHQQGAAVGVEGHQPALVAQDDDRPVAGLLPGVDDRAGGGRPDGRPLGRREVDPVVAPPRAHPVAAVEDALQRPGQPRLRRRRRVLGLPRGRRAPGLG